MFEVFDHVGGIASSKEWQKRDFAQRVTIVCCPGPIKVAVFALIVSQVLLIRRSNVVIVGWHRISTHLLVDVGAIGVSNRLSGLISVDRVKSNWGSAENVSWGIW